MLLHIVELTHISYDGLHGGLLAVDRGRGRWGTAAQDALVVHLCGSVVGGGNGWVPGLRCGGSLVLGGVGVFGLGVWMGLGHTLFPRDYSVLR